MKINDSYGQFKTEALALLAEIEGELPSIQETSEINNKLHKLLIKDMQNVKAGAGLYGLHNNTALIQVLENILNSSQRNN